MRLIMRVCLPSATENTALSAPDFELKWQLMLKRIGALSVDAREQGRMHFVLLDIAPAQITPAAEAVFRLTGVKPDFLPQIVPPPYFGVRH
jgi:hypothetical protein